MKKNFLVVLKADENVKAETIMFVAAESAQDAMKSVLYPATTQEQMEWAANAKRRIMAMEVPSADGYWQIELKYDERWRELRFTKWKD